MNYEKRESKSSTMHASLGAKRSGWRDVTLMDATWKDVSLSRHWKDSYDPAGYCF